MKKNTYFALGIILTICFNITVMNASAATEWTVKQGEYLEYSVKIQNDGIVTAEGTFNLTIGAIDTAAETLQYSISSDLSVDTINLAQSLDVTSQQINEPYLSLTAFNVIAIYDHNAFIIFKNDTDHYIKELSEEYMETYGDFDTYRYGIKQLSYGWEIKLWNIPSNVNTYFKIQYDKDGILTTFENSTLSSDGKETGVKISLLKYSGASGGIPGYSGWFIAGFSLITFGTLAIVVIKKQKSK
ncbi:MAG: hypothetical protein K9W44_12120 [Candidatus Lokiarchaeota archaeon]|nr:hypothetical protein [Candidatus Harpocratesius repetitus]